MASAKKTAGKGKKGGKPAKRAPPKKGKDAGAAAKAKAQAKALAAKKAAEAEKLALRKKKEQEAAKKRAAAEAAKKKIAAERERQRRELEKKREAQRREKDKQSVEKRIESEKDKVRRQMEKQAETQRKALERQMEAERKARQKQEETAKKAAEREAERARKEAEKKALAEQKAAEKAAAAAAKAAEKAAASGKKRAIPMSSLAATPIFRPLGVESPTLAPPPPPSKPGHVDHQIVSAITYGLFAAVNKTFGFAGQSVVKNASLRMLEYGYKRGWLPPRAKEPVRALNEFFGRLETMGYAEKIHVAKRGDSYALEVVGLADFDAVHSLREMHYPLLPVFLGAMLEAIADQYFQLKATLDATEFQEQKRGLTIPFSLHERTTAIPEVSRLPAARAMDDYED